MAAKRKRSKGSAAASIAPKKRKSGAHVLVKAGRARQRGPSSSLTPELAKELIRTHERNEDFAQAAAILCGVHPKLLSKWLVKGLEPDPLEPYASFAIAFLQAEMRIRAKMLRDLRNAKAHHRVTALTWLLGKRFGDYGDSRHGVLTVDLLGLLDEAQASTGLNPEQRREVLRRMLDDPTQPVSQLLAECGYFRREKITNGPQEPDPSAQAPVH